MITRTKRTAREQRQDANSIKVQVMSAGFDPNHSRFIMFLEGAFVHINGAGEIGGAVERALNPDAAMRARIEEMRDLLFYKLDGRASERIVNIIEERIEGRLTNGDT